MKTLNLNYRKLFTEVIIIFLALISSIFFSIKLYRTYEPSFFGHDKVPIEIWLPCILSICTFGIAISNRLNSRLVSIILWWPGIHFLLVLIGIVVPHTLLFMFMYAPFNFIGECVSIGVIITLLYKHLKEDHSKTKIIISLLINLLIMTISVIDISNRVTLGW